MGGVCNDFQGPGSAPFLVDVLQIEEGGSDDALSRADHPPEGQKVLRLSVQVPMLPDRVLSMGQV